MLDFYRRLWQAFFVGSPALAAIAWLFKDYPIAFTILLILASICFIIALIGLWRDFIDARVKEREARIVKDYEALKESFRRANPEWTEEQLEIATRGR